MTGTRQSGFTEKGYAITIMFKDETFLDLNNVTCFDTTGDLYSFYTRDTDRTKTFHVNPAQVVYMEIIKLDGDE